MSDWSPAPESREQMVLFPERLDDAIPKEHRVRLLDEILSRVDWTSWESRYEMSGRNPIHPRVLASVLLYGYLTRIQSSRTLEEALCVRLDFRWLAEGRSIDHTTLSEFRRTRSSELKDLFVQIGLIARQMGLLSLDQLAFDGTRFRANNRRSGSRTPQRLRELKVELEAKYAAIEEQVSAADHQDEERLGLDAAHTLPKELSDVKQRQEQVDKALAVLEQMENAGHTIPSRLPITDPESRISPNKEGGFAPNYTPLATVDTDEGFIVSVDVIPATDEHSHLVAAVDDVQNQFKLESPPAEVLGDGLMATGEVLSELESRGVTRYSPAKEEAPLNPALRDDPTQPVPQELWEQLPTKTIKRKGQQYQQLDKSAFIFDTENDCYWCPQGKPLPHVHTTRETEKGRKRIRYRHLANPEDCSVCPLRERCLSRNAKQRRINREQHEKVRIEHAQRMATQEAQTKYERRRHISERPFAVIKHTFGFRRFLLRGLSQVRTEWQWMATAFNLHRLLHLWGRAGPEASLPSVITND